MNIRLAIGRRFARIATMLVVRWPALWRLLRRPMELEFDLLAPRWETSQKQAAPLEAIASNGLAQQNAETRFIEEEEAGGLTAKSDAVSATGSAFRM